MKGQVLIKGEEIMNKNSKESLKDREKILSKRKNGNKKNGDQIKELNHSERISLMRENSIKKANLKVDRMKTD